MDDLDNSKGFLKHVFNFDDESKGDILNLLQYIFIALIPIVLLNKSMQKYVPELDEKKGSIEITAEILIGVVAVQEAQEASNALLSRVEYASASSRQDESACLM